MKTPYVGITDFMNPEQVRRMISVLESCGNTSNRRLMVGVMMSRKTLNNIPTKSKDAMPAKESVGSIFIPDERLLNTLHYADHDGVDVLENLERATSYSGSNLHALQLDMDWPKPDVIRRYREAHPHVQIVIQGNRKALEQVDNNPTAFVLKLKEYGDTIDFVLLDKRGGRGLGMDAQELMPLAGAVAAQLPQLGIGAAGGLGPETLHLVEPLVREFPNMSIDAQGRLRPSGSALDPIDWNMATTYLKRAFEMFQKHQSKS